MKDDIDFQIDDELIDTLVNISKRSPKLIKNKFKRIGQNATKKAKELAYELVKVGKKAKNAEKKYHKGFKTSKVFVEEKDNIKVSTYNKRPHAHLIEFGHLKVNKKKEVLGYVAGKFVVEKSSERYKKNEFTKDLENILNEVLNEGGF